MKCTLDNLRLYLYQCNQNSIKARLRHFQGTSSFGLKKDGVRTWVFSYLPISLRMYKNLWRLSITLWCSLHQTLKTFNVFQAMDKLLLWCLNSRLRVHLLNLLFHIQDKVSFFLFNVPFPSTWLNTCVFFLLECSDSSKPRFISAIWPSSALGSAACVVSCDNLPTY